MANYESDRQIIIKTLLDKKKGKVIDEFEKVCPTDTSLKRIIKEMHNIFDSIGEELNKIIDM